MDRLVPVFVFDADFTSAARPGFSFSFHDFTLENLTHARHADELEKSRERYLYIDHRHRGLGSNSCGPQPEAEYELPMSAFEWDFRISR